MWLLTLCLTICAFHSRQFHCENSPGNVVCITIFGVGVCGRDSLTSDITVSAGHHDGVFVIRLLAVHLHYRGSRCFALYNSNEARYSNLP